MTPDSPNSPREELEARLTALLLGELSAEDAAALRQAIDQDPELARLENQLKETIGLVREAADSQDEKALEPAAALQLSAERREKLLASFKTASLPVPAKPRRKFRINRELLKLAAMVVALFLVGGVLVSYFTVSVAKRGQIFAGEGMLGLDLVDAGEDPGELKSSAYFTGVPPGNSEQTKAYIVTVTGGSDPARGTFKSSDSPGSMINRPESASGRRSGDNSSRVQISGQGLAINGQAPESRDTTFGTSRSSAQTALEQQRRTPADKAPASPPASRPEQADKQLAQNARGFRTTVALPTPVDAYALDTTFDTSGGTVASSGVQLVGRGSSRADDFASVALAGSGKVEVEELSKAQSRTGLSTGGGFGIGGFGGRGPIVAAEGKDAVRLPDAGLPTVQGRAFESQTEGNSQRFGGQAGAGIQNLGTVPLTTQPLGDLADAKTADRLSTDLNRNGAVAGFSFGSGNKELAAAKPPMSTANSDWFGTTDVNGPAPAPAQRPLGRTASRGEAVNASAPVVAANPVPAVDPATRLPAASASAGKDSTLMGFWDTGIDTERRPTPAPVVAQPASSPTKQASPGSYEFALTSDDHGGLRMFKNEGQPATTPVAPATATVPQTAPPAAPAVATAQPVPSPAKQAPPAVATTAGVLSFETATPSAPSRDGQAMAGEQVTDLAAVVDVDTPQLLAGRETVQRTPARTIRIPAGKPAETPASDQKPDATKSTSFADDMDTVVLTQPEHNAVLAFSTPAPAMPAMPAPATEPTRELKTKSTESAQNWRANGDLAQKNEQDAPVALGVTTYTTTIAITNAPAAANYFGDTTFSSDGLIIGQGQQSSGIGGVPIADPNFGTGGGREWGIRQKLDGDGDRATRFDQLNDLTRPSQKVAVVEAQGIQNKLGKVEPLADKEQKKEGQLAGHESITVHRFNGSKERVTAGYGFVTNMSFVPDAKAKKQAEPTDEFTVTMSRTDGRLGGPGTAQYEVLREGGAKPFGQIAAGAEFDALDGSKRVSEDSVSRRSRVEIALPPGGENVQLMEREPRMQTGPVAVNEVQLESLHKEEAILGSKTIGETAKADGIQRAKERRNYYSLKRDLDTAKYIGDQLQSAAQLSASLETNASSTQLADLSRQLGTLTQVREQLQKRLWQEKVEAALPRSEIVEIYERAEAPAKGSSVLSRISGAFSGDPVATTRIEAQKAASRSGRTSFESSEFDPYWTQTQLEKIQSKAVLEKVIEKLDLNDAWAKERGGGNKLSTEDTLALLKKKLNVRQDPNSSLIEIQVKDNDGAEAARVANTIAEVYRDSSLEQRKAMATEGLRQLTAEAGSLEKQIARLSEELERRQKELKPAEVDEKLPKLAATAGIPQPEVQSAENNFSTFSLNVSDVSFKLAAASLEKGQMPDPATVRSEEFINAFDYRDPEPKGSAPIAFAWERARYPFAHNRDLLRFSVKTAASGRQPGRPLNLVLLLDNSGSMERADRVSVINECIRVLSGQLQPQDRVSVVAFARTARLAVDGLTGTNIVTLPQQIGQLAPDGGTNLEEAMNLAYQKALEHFQPNGVNRVVLLTDGAANLGDVEPESLKKKVEAHRKQGVALDCFGIGWDGYNDDLLEVLSRNGDGRYGFVNTPEAAASEFAGQLAGALRVAASDVKVQVEFNPRRVTAYRQIGYAKHQLKKEQFRDNTVDAAEIGAAEQGNALYTVQVNPNGEGPLGIVRVRFKVPGTSDYREHEWAVPYSGAATPLEQSSPALRLAASASAFSEWLVSSPFAAEVTPDRLLGYLSGVPETSTADPRPKKLEWMIRQARSLAGK